MDERALKPEMIRESPIYIVTLQTNMSHPPLKLTTQAVHTLIRKREQRGDKQRCFPPFSSSAVFANWGSCTLQTPRFGFTRSTDPQSMKDKLVKTETIAGPATKTFKRKKDPLLPE